MRYFCKRATHLLQVVQEMGNVVPLEKRKREGNESEG